MECHVEGVKVICPSLRAVKTLLKQVMGPLSVNGTGFGRGSDPEVFDAPAYPRKLKERLSQGEY